MERLREIMAEKRDWHNQYDSVDRSLWMKKNDFYARLIKREQQKISDEQQQLELSMRIQESKEQEIDVEKKKGSFKY